MARAWKGFIGLVVISVLLLIGFSVSVKACIGSLWLFNALMLVLFLGHRQTKNYEREGFELRGGWGYIMMDTLGWSLQLSAVGATLLAVLVAPLERAFFLGAAIAGVGTIILLVQRCGIFLRLPQRVLQKKACSVCD